MGNYSDKKENPVYGDTKPIDRRLDISLGTGCNCDGCGTDCALKELGLGSKHKYIKSGAVQITLK